MLQLNFRGVSTLTSIESQESEPPRARHVLKEIRKLYHIERWAKRNNYTVEEIKDLHQENAYPIIQKLEQMCIRFSVFILSFAALVEKQHSN